MAKGFTEQERAKGFELFNVGESTNQVAARVFNKNYGKAKKLRDEYDAQKQDGGANEIAPADEPEAWDVTLQLPTARMDEILMRFSPQEKADAITAVLQGRLNAEV